MKVHEYQAKRILRDHGIPVPRGEAVSTAGEARRVAAELGGVAVVKAQVHAGGRGKAGGIRPVNTPDEAAEAAADMLGGPLVTAQTGPGGAPVAAVLVEERLDVARELYLGVVVDADAGAPVVMASTEGGVEIELVAEQTSEKIVRALGDPLLGLTPYRARELAYALEVPPDLVRPTADLVSRLYRLFVEKDCSLAEVNPLAVTKDGRVLALDAKLSFEDDALFRHPELRELADPTQEDEFELRAGKAGLSYVKLEGGRVGCMVNGAGLAMATMDITRTAGAEPANFLDVGGGADEDQIAEAFRIIVSDPDVKAVFINLFGGILRCDAAARGVAAAAAQADVRLPVVALMRGTNADEGRQILLGTGLDVRLADDLVGATELLARVLGQGAGP
ncbi:MAG: ADP-forming succinate--CoA ligase subunit beta [Gemmatimonadetes bacterium]|nr:ADP-forming succinate--CoA ligase subunit beta [Gemmatimonadota bacterium]